MSVKRTRGERDKNVAREKKRERESEICGCVCVWDLDCRWHDAPLSVLVGAPAAGLQISHALGNVDCAKHRDWEKRVSEERICRKRGDQDEKRRRGGSEDCPDATHPWRGWAGPAQWRCEALPPGLES